MENVIKYVLQKYKKKGKNFDALVVLQPTSPLRKIETVIKAIQKFKKYRPDYLASVTKLSIIQIQDGI